MRRLSVVVCTHDRPRDLGRCLEALSRLEDEVEVIVVDSASEPPCRDLVERFGFAYLREDEPGLSRARNRGAAAATGEIVAFVDDDATPRPDWARRLVEPFSDLEIGCVGGACLAVFPDRPRPRWLSDRLLQFAGITRFRAAREARSSAEWPFGANIAFRRQALEQAGGFPEDLGRVGRSLLSGEESALIESLRALAWRVWLEPAAIVEHAVSAERCESSYYWRRLWWAGAGRARRRGGLRLLAAAPVRLLLYALTRDRVHLYRTAETAGYVAERARRRPAALLAALLFALALLVRLQQQRRGLLYPDGYQYLLMARGIAEHLRPTTVLGPGGDLFVPSADAAAKPLYPALVAAVHGTGASWLEAARTVTALAAAAAVALTGAVGRRLTGSLLAGAAAGLLLLASPSLAFWSGFSGPDPLAQALALAAALALLHRRPLLGGVLVGLAAATRPELLLLGLAAGLYRRDRAALRAGVAAALTLAAILLALRPPLALPEAKLLLVAAPLLLLACAPLRLALPAAGAVAVALAAAGRAPGLVALWRDDWPLLLLAAAGAVAARRAALPILGAAALLAGVYWTKNPGLERYPALLLPLAALLAAFLLTRRLALVLAVPALAVLALNAPALGSSREDSFSAVAAEISHRLSPSEPLVSAAPEAYGFWLPHQPVRTMRPGERGFILLDAAQRFYEPQLGARGRVLVRVDDEAGFFRPDGVIDPGLATLVSGRVEAIRGS